MIVVVRREKITRMPNGDDKNWGRFCAAVDGFHSKFERWPKRVRMNPNCYVDLVSHVLNPLGFALISSHITLVPEEDAKFIADDGTGAEHCYGTEHDWNVEVAPMTRVFFGDAVLQSNLGTGLEYVSLWDANGKPMNENAEKQGPINRESTMRVENSVEEEKPKKALGKQTMESNQSLPCFWKLSMAGDDYKTILDVLDWVHRGVVLVHKNTRPKGTSQTSQGDHFIESDRIGDYFYLCHGNHEPAVILLGQFTGPPNVFCDRGNGWTERTFRWIKTSASTKAFGGQAKWWAPNHNSTFVKVPEDELTEFESEILIPYFAIELKDFGIQNTE